MNKNPSEKVSLLQKNIKVLIKRRLKEKGWNYFDLAEHMDVQVLTVRRWMTSRPMKLDQFLKMMLILDIQIFSKMEEDFRTPLKTTIYTLEQEVFLSQNPLAALVFIKLVVGFKVDDLKTQYKLSQKSFLQILRELESLNLLQLWPGEKIKVKVRGPFRMIAHGPLSKSYFDLWVSIIQKHFVENFKQISEPTDKLEMSIFRPFELYLSPQSAKDFTSDVLELFSKYRQLNAVEYTRRSKVVPVSGILAIDQFDSWEKVFLTKSR